MINRILSVECPFYWRFYSHSTDHSTLNLLIIQLSLYWAYHYHSTRDYTSILLMILLPFYSHSTDDSTPILRIKFAPFLDNSGQGLRTPLKTSRRNCVTFVPNNNMVPLPFYWPFYLHSTVLTFYWWFSFHSTDHFTDDSTPIQLEILIPAADYSTPILLVVHCWDPWINSTDNYTPNLRIILGTEEVIHPELMRRCPIILVSSCH